MSSIKPPRETPKTDIEWVRFFENAEIDIDTGSDVIIDLATKGLVLKDTQSSPHYWRITIDNTGSLVITDLGTSKP